MTDLYVSSRNPRRVWLPLLLLVFVLLLVWWKFGPSRTSVPAPEIPLPTATPRPSPTPVPGAPTPAPRDFASVRSLIETGSFQQARAALETEIPALEDPMERHLAEKLLGEANIRLVFSPDPMPEKVEHVVRSGESLGLISKRYGANIELIAAAHGIRGHLIRPGDRLQILQGKFRVHVSKSRNELTLFFNDRFFKRYVVGTGTDGGTPIGNYVITLRMTQPVWYRPDGASIPYGHPDNLLGTHYLKLNLPGIGLHGTWEPESIGSQSSAGCVRLLNSEIEELFLLLPEGTPVEIVE